MKISKDKKYKLRMGGDIKIYEIFDGYVFGAYKVDGSKEWSAARWENEGHYQLDGESCLDLIEISPYADFKIDDKVLVWYKVCKLDKYKRHFAGISELGKPLAWVDGMTSFTTDETTDWENCEKYND